MKKVFSETERRRLKKAQLRLLKDDLESASIMIREKEVHIFSSSMHWRGSSIYGF